MLVQAVPTGFSARVGGRERQPWRISSALSGTVFLHGCNSTPFAAYPLTPLRPGCCTLGTTTAGPRQACLLSYSSGELQGCFAFPVVGCRAWQHQGPFPLALSHLVCEGAWPARCRNELTGDTHLKAVAKVIIISLMASCPSPS